MAVQPQAWSEQSQAKFEADRRSLVDLWNEAQVKFRSIAGDNYIKFTSTKAITDYGNDQMQNFHHFRHNQGKVDQLRSLFASNIEYIETGTAAIASAASGAFPPAAAIGTAIAFVLGACKQVSADYDLLTDFFEDMNNFLQRVTIIEDKIPASKPYQNCLVEVFGSLLEMCAHAGKDIQNGRLKKWLLKALSIDNSDLGGSKKKMEIALSRLQSATEFAILNNTEKLQEMTLALQRNQEKHTEMLKAQTFLIESGFQSMDKELKKIITMLQKQDGARANVAIVSGKDEVATMRKIENFLNFQLNVLEKVFDEARDVFVSGTCQWLFEEPMWESWVSPENLSQKMLIVSGRGGCGKTHLAISAYENLRAQVRSNPDTTKSCVGCFLFKDRVNGLNDMYSAMAAITIQIAQQNPLICEQINARMARQDHSGAVSNWNDIWTKHIAVHFQKGSPHHLQLVIDGVDELPSTQMEEFFEFVEKLIKDPSTQISVIIMIRPAQLAKCQEMAMGVISADPPKQKHDYDSIIQHRFTTSRRLRNLDDDIKQKAVQILENSSDSILYVEYMLRNFKTFERRSSLLKQLNTTLPPDLDHIYLTLLDDYARRLVEQQLAAARMVLMWVAFALVHPTLEEITALLAQTGHQDFKLEEELQKSQLRRFLIMKSETQKGRSSPEYHDDPLEVIQENTDELEYQDGTVLVRFWDRSMREFFQAMSRDEPGLRTGKSEAHRRMFLICSEILRHSSETKSGLLKYVSEYWLVHHSCVSFDDHDHIEQVGFLEATALLLHDSSNLPSNLAEADTDFLQIREHLGGYSDALLSIKNCVEKSTPNHLADLSETARSWFDSIKLKLQDVLLAVSRKLVRQWLQTEDIMKMYKPYWLVRSCLVVGGLPPFDFAHMDKNDFRDISKKVYLESSGSLLPYTEIQEVVNTFTGAITLHAYTVIYKTTVDRFNTTIEAMDALDKYTDIILESKDDDQQSWYKAVVVLGMALQQFANTLVELEATLGPMFGEGVSDFYQQGVDILNELLTGGIESVPHQLLTLAYATLADLKFQLNQPEESLVAHAKVREYSGTDYIDAKSIKEELKRTRVQRNEEQTSNLVKSWRLVDALAYMTSNFYKRETYHKALRYIAAAVSDREFLIHRYQEVIHVLEGLQSAAPIQIELATCYQHVYNDVSAAKKLLNQVLDGAASGDLYVLTNEEPEWALGQAINKMSDILYEEFRATTNPELKFKLYKSSQELLSRRLATQVNISATALLHHKITQARMLKRLGPAQDFQKTLNEAFQTCYESLTDSIGWNDRASLINLCKILALVDGMEDEMAIAMSARFSELNAFDESAEGAVVNGTQDDKPQQQNYDYSNMNEFDLSDEVSFCEGSTCSPDRVLTYSSEPILYDCLICSSCLLCAQCYQRRQAWNEAEAKDDESKKAANSNQLLFCGLNHKYISGPVKGWRGIKEGVMYIDRRPPIKFIDWLKRVKTEKWPRAWDKFWLAEGLAG